MSIIDEPGMQSRSGTTKPRIKKTNKTLVLPVKSKKNRGVRISEDDRPYVSPNYAASQSSTSMTKNKKGFFMFTRASRKVHFKQAEEKNSQRP